MNNRVIYPVMLLVGVGIGTGAGMLISKPKIDEQKKQIDQLVTQMQTTKTESEGIIQRAATQIAGKESELKRNKELLMQMTAQLSMAKAELNKIKSQSPEPSITSPGTTEPEVVITTPTGTAATTATVDYTIQDGDSFWKIAEQQLGDGLRYTEILNLNPDISENQTLVIGTKIKIPAR